MVSTGRRNSNVLSLLISLAALSACDGSGGQQQAAATVAAGGTASRGMAEMVATMTVTTDGSGIAMVETALEDAVTGEPLKLTNGDRLFASASGGGQQTMTLDPGSMVPSYTTDIDVSGSSTGTVLIYFQRGGRYRGVGGGLPRDFTVLSPMDADATSFASMLPLEWTEIIFPEQPMRVEFSLACTLLTGAPYSRTFTIEVDDDGLHDFDMSSLPEASDPDIDPYEDCTLDLVFERFELNSSPGFWGSASTLRKSQLRGVSGIRVVF